MIYKDWKFCIFRITANPPAPGHGLDEAAGVVRAVETEWIVAVAVYDDDHRDNEGVLYWRWTWKVMWRADCPAIAGSYSV
jgi:hypothetical protein